MAAYYYGSFNINDGINYFVTGKDNLSFPEVKQVYFKIGRLEGVKKTGESVDQKTITLNMMILGVSRYDLENRIDVLYQNLNKRGQYLQLHTNDNRQYIADCIKADFPLKQGDILVATGTVTFVLTSPYAISSTASTYDSGAVTLTLVSGSTYTFPAFSITGGGNVFSRPSIHFANNTAVAWTQVQIQQQTDSQTLTITSNLPSASGDYLDIYCDPSGNNGFSAIKNGVTQCALNGIFPIIEPTLTNFVVTINAPSAPHSDVTFSWNPRFLS